MNFDWDALAKIVVAIVPGIVAVIGLARGPGAIRSRLKHDVDLLEKLPDGSDARELLLKHVESQVQRLFKLETDATRDLPMFAFSVIAAPLLGFLAIWLFQRQTWWGFILSALVGLLALVFLYGIFETAQRVPRDSKGKRI